MVLCADCVFLLPDWTSMLPAFGLIAIVPASRAFRLMRAFLGGRA